MFISFSGEQPLPTALDTLNVAVVVTALVRAVVLACVVAVSMHAAWPACVSGRPVRAG
jgi:hypothetical protein